MRVILIALSFWGCKPGSEAKPPVRVAAASDLSAAFAELGSAFEQETGQLVHVTFGSAGQLTRQLQQGAPFDLFAAASLTFVDQAVKAGACDGETRALYGRGRVVVWTKGGAVAPVAKLEDLADARFVKVAIANPEHAPYGQAAREALKSAGLSDAVGPKLVFAENVRQALQLAESGNTEAAIVALSLVVQDEHNPRLLIDEALHLPIEQALVVCRHGANAAGARAFAARVASPSGRALMGRFGFVLPERP